MLRNKKEFVFLSFRSQLIAALINQFFPFKLMKLSLASVCIGFMPDSDL